MPQALEDLISRLSVRLEADSWEGLLRVILSFDGQEISRDSVPLSELASSNQSS